VTKQAKADFMLLIVTLFWGSSYVLTKVGLGTLEPFNLTALRFIIAFGVTAPVFGRNILKADLKTYKYAFVLAVILFATFMAMTFGLERTTASNAGFLASLAVVIIPVISFFFLKQKIEMKVIAGVFLALAGIALLTLDARLQVNPGDILCFFCAVLFAVHVVVTEVFTKKVDSIALGVLQLGFAAILSTAFSLATENMHFPDSARSWLVVLALSLLCTAVGYIAQTTAQKYTSATHAGLIFSLEPVFSAVFSFAMLGEVLAPRGYLGAVILMAGVLIAELDFKKIAHKDAPTEDTGKAQTQREGSKA
jgi:drug/metabolite transporter (DMT)-like permease